MVRYAERLISESCAPARAGGIGGKCLESRRMAGNAAGAAKARARAAARRAQEEAIEAGIREAKAAGDQVNNLLPEPSEPDSAVGAPIQGEVSGKQTVGADPILAAAEIHAAANVYRVVAGLEKVPPQVKVQTSLTLLAGRGHLQGGKGGGQARDTMGAVLEALTRALELRGRAAASVPAVVVEARNGSGLDNSAPSGPESSKVSGT